MEKLKNTCGIYNQLTDATIGQMLEATRRKFPRSEAVKYPGGEYTRTWEQFNGDVDRTAKSLLGMGIKKGDHVAVWATNYPQWLQLLFATAKIGVVLVPLNTNYKKAELEQVLSHSDAKALFYCDKPNKNTNGQEVVDSINIPALRHKISFDNDWNSAFAAYTATDEEFRHSKSLPKAGDVINIQYTSGTTGIPKGVMLTHHGLVNNSIGVASNLNFSEKDRLLIQVPFMHCFGISLSVLACTARGAAMIPLYTPSPTKALEACHNEKCTAFNGTPTMFIDMLNHEKFGDVDFSNMRTGIMAGATCPEPVMRNVMQKMKMRDISIVYGLTETSPGCTQTRIGDSVSARVSSVGRSLPHVQNKIVKIKVDEETGEKVADEKGAEALVGETGEFWTSGYHVMKGYYKNKEATDKVIFVDETGRRWLRTGDIASRDENENFQIKGRSKDVIIRGGENVYPSDVEAGLIAHDGIKEAQVVGIPDERLGEQVYAFIVKDDAAKTSEETIKDYVKKNMPNHQVPSHYHFIESFDVAKTASGKIKKFMLKEDLMKPISQVPAEIVRHPMSKFAGALRSAAIKKSESDGLVL